MSTERLHALADAAAAIAELEREYAGQVYESAYRRAKNKIVEIMLSEEKANEPI